MKFESNEKYFTTKEVAIKCRVHQRTVQRWIINGQLKAFKVGPKIWRIKEEDLLEFLSSNK
ncbi:hypothetical protein APP_03850 [Aeribacillus pallidus]|jgi:excisionase family DNA binding protein|nr:hypothetical protein APP_03850 [Aeribacillus pallidus]